MNTRSGAMTRRTAMMSAAALLMTQASARAADYPSSTIRIISPYSAGGGNDLSARIMAAALGPELGQSVIVENRTGAVGMIACEYVAKARPDGYTLLWASVDNLTMVPALKSKISYKVPDDFTFIARIAENGVAYVINPKLPVKNLAEFVAYAKANPGKLRFGSAGIGGAPHLATELFMKQTGIQMQHIPYRGISNAMTDLLGGQIDFVPLTPITVAAYVGSDQVRIIGYSGPTRHPLIPDVPTATELGYPKATETVWYSLIGPANMPKDVVTRLEKAVAAALLDSTLKDNMAKAGLTIAATYGAELRKNVVAELEQWKEIAKDQNIVMP